jgi:CDP-glycerol glycerophosphotransferase
VLPTRRAIRRFAGKTRRAGRKAVRRGRRQLLRRYYRIQLRAPIDPNLAVFAAYWYRGYSCNPRAIYEKLGEELPQVRGVWIVEREHAGSMPAGVEHVVAWTRDYYRLIARARFFVNNVNFPNDFVKREGTVHVQTHHGTPLKTMGLDLRTAYFAGSRMNFDLLLRRAERWDYSISSNAFSTEIWNRVYPVRCTTLEVGYPRNDVLANATEADVERIRDGLGIAPGQRAILLAPTHREYRGGYEPTADVERMAENLADDYVVLARLHYFYGEGLRPEARGRGTRVLDVTGHPSIEELCLAADVLVTDYSSIMFDYAVLDRPIVLHVPDWDEYREKRGIYLDLLAEPPGVVTTTDEELLEAFRSGAVWGEEATRLRSVFRERFASLDDGHASERVIRAVWLSEEKDSSGSATGTTPAPATIEAARSR